MKKLLKRFIIPLTALCLLYFILSVLVMKPAFQDDAFITFIYAENFRNGHGFAYNRGEFVEGFSSPLYTLLLGAVSWAVPAGIPSLSIIIAVISGMLCIILLYTMIRSLNSTEGLSAFCAMLVFTVFSPFLAETMQGMETVMYIFLITALIYTETNNTNRWIAKILYSAIILTRPEGFFLLAGYFAFKSFFDRKHIHNLTFSLIFYLALISMRYAYFGDFFPNTFYAKTPFSLDLLKDGISSNLIFFRKALPLMSGLVLMTALKARDLCKKRFILLYPAIFYIAFNSYIGGGFKFTHRYDIFALPCYTILFGLTVHHISSWIKKTHIKRVVLVVLVISAVLYHHYSFRRASGFHEARKTVIKRQIEFALYLKSSYPADTVLSTGQAGAIKYFSGFDNIDMLGLCDRHIAKGRFDDRGLNLAGHLKGDGKYILARKPDIILFHNGLFSKEPLDSSDVKDRVLSRQMFSGWLSEIEIMQSLEFWSDYRFRREKMSDFYVHYFEKTG